MADFNTPNSGTCVFVGNIPYDVSEKQLEEMFASVGNPYCPPLPGNLLEFRGLSFCWDCSVAVWPNRLFPTCERQGDGPFQGLRILRL